MNQFECYGQAASSHETDLTLISGRYSNQKKLIPLVVDDILLKIENYQLTSFLEVGCGVGNLFVPLSQHFNQSFGCDHSNLLDKISDRLDSLANIKLIPGNFFDIEIRQKIDFVLAYSVIHCLEDATQVYSFIDKAINLLSERGVLFIGDIPNLSLKSRFLSSESGKQFDSNWKQSLSSDFSSPAQYLNIGEQIKTPNIDDSFITDLMVTYNLKGYNVYRFPQSPHLPFGNTREDLLFIKPGTCL